MPLYEYKCLTEGGGCGQTWHAEREFDNRYGEMCPNCYTDGNETFLDVKTHRFKHKVEILINIPKELLEPVQGVMGVDVVDVLERARDHFSEAKEGPKEFEPKGEMIAVADLPEALNPPEDRFLGDRYLRVELEGRRRQGEVSEATEPEIFKKRMETKDPPYELQNPRKKRK